MVFKNYHQNVAYTEDLSMDEKSNKVKLLVYATEDDRARIKMVASIEELEKNGGARE